MAVGAPYYPMLSSYQYPPNIIYPGSVPTTTSLYSNQCKQFFANHFTIVFHYCIPSFSVAQMVPVSYRPYSSSSALVSIKVLQLYVNVFVFQWTPTSGVFFGADYVGGADLYLSATGFSAELENKTIRMERQLSLKNTVDFVDNQN